MRDQVQLNVRLGADTREALRRAAADDRRTMAAFAAIVLEDRLRELGYIKSRPASRRKAARPLASTHDP
jgi:hypothetical protein